MGNALNAARRRARGSARKRLVEAWNETSKRLSSASKRARSQSKIRSPCWSKLSQDSWRPRKRRICAIQLSQSSPQSLKSSCSPGLLGKTSRHLNGSEAKNWRRFEPHGKTPRLHERKSRNG